MLRVPTHRAPIHPGEMLREEFLEPMGMTQRELAERIGVPYRQVSELVSTEGRITPSTALRLARHFGTSSRFWTNLQLRCDRYRAQREEAELR